MSAPPLDARGQDPRLDPATLSDDLIIDDLEARPTVGRQGGGMPTALLIALFALAGVSVFFWMNARREARLAQGEPEAVSAEPAIAAAPAPLELQAPPAATGPMFQLPGPQFTTNNAVSPPPAPLPANPALVAPLAADLAARDPLARRRAPALVVDFGGQAEAQPAIPSPALQPPAARPGAELQTAAADAANGLSAEDRFASRVAGGEAERARATTLRNLGELVPQGAVIPAVLETAINSDLPGFTRAVVSRDVASFDGKNVLIPRGSRLIGQYKSGVALGASRVFVIWTRVIRPDGVSVQLGSPGTDPLGRGGMGGDVDRHFFQRFGGSILLSVLNGGIMALANSGRDGAQVYIGSPTDASNVAAQALQKDGGVPPTIKTPQGAPVRIFVARDLDFSGVASVKK